MIIDLCWIFVFLVAILSIVFAVYVSVKLPRDSQIEALKEWLKYAVTIAEKELGSGTGSLKLRMVYDLFTDKFTFLADRISFETFSEYVDEALVWMNAQLETNNAVAAFVEGTLKTITK